MNKTDLIKAYADKRNRSKADAERDVNAIIKIIEKAVAENQTVVITGFGTFSASVNAEKHVRNPKTGEMMTVSSRTVPRFKAGKTFKDMLNSHED